MTTIRIPALLLLLGALPAAAPLAAQNAGTRGTVERAPGPQYEASGLKRTVLGANWRELWTRPLTLPVLDVETFRGGLEMERQGGGNQSVTLHMVDASGKGWVFRSLDKYPEQGLPPDLKGSAAGAVVADQTSTLHPGGAFVVPRLLGALGILHLVPTLYVMGDSPRLGQFRETFADMIGLLEEKPNEGPDDTPGFGGSRKIKDSDKLLEDLEESPEYRLDDREYLRARLVDFIINDTDRGTDQWRWARFGDEGAYTYRPIPRDRDWAFVNGDGLLARMIRGTFPKLAEFGDDFPKLASFTFSSHLLDRRLLTRPTRAEFDAEVAHVQRALTDDVIRAAVADLPAAFQPGHADELAQDLIERRDDLDEIVAPWYTWLFREPDLRATDEDEIVHLRHQPDGSLRVTMATREAPETAYYDRTFLPNETHEVRVYLHGGADHAIVSGSPARVRTVVVGGGGDDVLEDATGRARFYDDRGDNDFRTRRGTYVSTRGWEAPEVPEGVRLGRAWAPDYGKSDGFGPRTDYNDNAGLIVGASYTRTNYGFRRLPYAWRATASVLYGTRSGGWGGVLALDYRGENTSRGLAVELRATELDTFSFHGLGNDTPELADEDDRLVTLDRVRFHPALVWHLGPRPGAPSDDEDEEEADDEEAGEEEEAESSPQRPFVTAAPAPSGRITLGPVVQWTNPHFRTGNPLEGNTDFEDFGQAGAQLTFAWRTTDRAAAPRRGFTAALQATAFPKLWDVTEAYGTLAATATGYVPLVAQTHLALRAGGTHVLGDAYPVWDAAFVGGRTTLRGYEWQRFAGESAAHGSVELRVPVDTVEIFANGELGVFGLADAGRVWMDEESPGGWHTSWGGGVWFATMNQSVSLTYARGDHSRWYLWFGLPF